MDLGATHVMTYDDLEDKSTFERVKEWTGGKVCADLISLYYVSADDFVGYSATFELRWRKVYDTNAPPSREECPSRYIRGHGQGST